MQTLFVTDLDSLILSKSQVADMYSGPTHFAVLRALHKPLMT